MSEPTTSVDARDLQSLDRRLKELIARSVSNISEVIGGLQDELESLDRRLETAEAEARSSVADRQQLREQLTRVEDLLGQLLATARAVGELPIPGAPRAAERRQLSPDEVEQ